MSGSGRDATSVVSREYRCVPDDCLRALRLLLEKSVSKAARPLPEPDGFDRTKSKEDSAHAGIMPKDS